MVQPSLMKDGSINVIPNIRYVQEILGHLDINSTQKVGGYPKKEPFGNAEAEDYKLVAYNWKRHG
jgi:hypothetical protein